MIVLIYLAFIIAAATGLAYDFGRRGNFKPTYSCDSFNFGAVFSLLVMSILWPISIPAYVAYRFSQLND